MTDRPYTDDDLRTEAARQHATLTEDPDFMGVGEQMDCTPIESTDEPGPCTTWDELDEEQFDAAQRQIHELIDNAADVSEWAVGLGADGLEPEDHAITLDGDGTPLVRMHLAFHPDMDDAARQGFCMRLARVMADAL